jgi:hypothetical protein
MIRQLGLPFECGAMAPDASPRLWLLAGDRDVTRLVPRLLGKAHLLIDAENAASGIPSTDLIMVRSSVAGHYDLYAPPYWRSATGQGPEAEARRWLAGGLRATHPRSTDILIVSAHRLDQEIPRIVGSSTHLERFFAQIAAPGLLAGHPRRRALCRAVWEDTMGVSDATLRALIRLEAERHVTRPDQPSEVVEALACVRSERLQALVAQLLSKADDERLDERQAEFEWAPRTRQRQLRMGYTVRRVAALRLGSAAPILTDHDSAGKHVRERVASLEVEQASLIAMLSGVSSRLIKVDARVAENAPNASEPHLELAIDWEFRALNSVAGLCGSEGAGYDVELSSDTCEVAPTSMRMRVGNPAIISISPGPGRLHNIRVTAYSGEGRATGSTVRLSVTKRPGGAQHHVSVRRA